MDPRPVRDSDWRAGTRMTATGPTSVPLETPSTLRGLAEGASSSTVGTGRVAVEGGRCPLDQGPAGVLGRVVGVHSRSETPLPLPSPQTPSSKPRSISEGTHTSSRKHVFGESRGHPVSVHPLEGPRKNPTCPFLNPGTLGTGQGKDPLGSRNGGGSRPLI